MHAKVRRSLGSWAFASPKEMGNRIPGVVRHPLDMPFRIDLCDRLVGRRFARRNGAEGRAPSNSCC